MWWPSDLDKGFNKAQESAIRQMITEHDEPRRGLAGGVSQVRPCRRSNGNFDVVALGTSAEHTGLIKSVRANGSFDGTVYTVPFHAHVDVETIEHSRLLRIGPVPKPLATITDVRQGAALEVVFTIDEFDRQGTVSKNDIRVDFVCNGVRLDDKRVVKLPYVLGVDMNVA